MFYDYVITQFYPKIGYLIALHIIAIVVSFLVYKWNADFVKDQAAYIKKWRFRLVMFLLSQFAMLSFYAWLPDVEYVKHFYGEVRVVKLTPEQIAQQEAELQAETLRLQAENDRRFEQSKQLLLDCLEKGQKQPHTTTFNDTNEVVKTCYKVSKQQF